MKRFQVVGLCLAAVFAFSAVMVASASAELPEYKACAKQSKNPTTKKYEGEYSGKKCGASEKSATKEGKYERVEWNKGKSASPSFKGKNEGAPHNNLVDPICPTGQFNETSHKCNAPEGSAKANEPADIAGTTTCTKEKVEGKITGAKTQTWKTVYGKCEALETPCNTAGKPAGTIETDELESTLVYLGKGKTNPGLRVKGKGVGKKASSRLAQYECLGGVLKVEVYGEVLAKQSGNTNEAEKSVKSKVEEGPLKLQSDLYIEENETEEFAKATFIWGHNFLECVKEGVTEDGESQAMAEGTCFGEVGPYPGFPEPGPKLPVMLESETSLGTAPAVQNGVSNAKGDKEILIEG